jgi:hypothetical protein
MKCRLLREAFKKFWQYQSVAWVKEFLHQQIFMTMRKNLPRESDGIAGGNLCAVSA